MPTYNPVGPMPRGCTVIEASAGTGKTYQITNLVLRLVAEFNVPLREILVVTFTNAATAELRERVRTRISEGISALQAAPGNPPDPGDRVLTHLVSCAEEELSRRLQRLADAREDFDAAAIRTIHGFCQDVLRENAFEAGVDLDAELVADASEVYAEVADDWLTNRSHAMSAAEVGVLRDQFKVSKDSLRKLVVVAAERDRSLVLPSERIDVAALVPAAREALEAFRDGGKQAWIAVCQRSGLTGGASYGCKKDGAPGSNFAARLVLYEESLGRISDGLWAYASATRFDVENFYDKAPGNAVTDVPGLEQGLAVLHRMNEALNNERFDFLEWAAEEIPRRLAQRAQRTYADLLNGVGDAVEAEPGGALVQSLRKRFQAALIDEFQDTDAVQWSIFRTVFDEGRDEEGQHSHRLFLIGDPKQAIYGFRGADVFVYLSARRSASSQATMTVNYRSDGRFVAAMNALYHEHDSVLEQPGLSYVPVTHAPRNGWNERLGHAPGAPLHIRWVDERSRCEGIDKAEPIPKPEPARYASAAACAEDIREWLDGTPPLHVGVESPTPVNPGDIAVLVRSHHEGRLVREALRKRKIPSITAAQGNVLESREAEDVLAWLRCMAEPKNAGAARVLALSPLGGWTATRVAAVVDGVDPNQEWPAWMERIHRWSEGTARVGFARIFDRHLARPKLLSRLAELEDTERRLTNYRHLSELLHAASTEQGLGPQALVRWLVEGRARDEDSELLELRLESDARAVRIVTLHTSKGLQYPFVFLPFCWSTRKPRSDDASWSYHADGGQRVRDARIDRKDAKEVAERESGWEALRLLYVGLTRARHRAVAYWAWSLSGGKPAVDGPLTHLLFGDGHEPRSAHAADLVVRATDQGDPAALEEQLDLLVERGRRPKDGEPSIAWSVAPWRPAGLWSQRGEQPEELPAARFFDARGLDRLWRRYSYSGLTRNRHGRSEAPEWALAADADREARDHADGFGGEEVDLAAPVLEVSSVEEVPLAAMPGGTEIGTFVHRVFEHLDFQILAERNGLKRPLLEYIRAEGPAYGLRKDEHHELLAAQLPHILRTPLGEQAGGVCLEDIGSTDRLDEWDFDLGLAGGDSYLPGDGRSVPGRALADLLGGSREPGSPIPDSYLAGLRDPSFRFPDMAGFLNGSIDLVYRVGVGNAQRWFIADYKTNRMSSLTDGVGGRRVCTPGHYSPPWLQHEMARHHYFVQYHLYLVALHRFLARRLPGYDIDRHLGGAVYLFVRGMLGEEHPESGVFFDRPPSSVILALDSLFEGVGVAS